MSTWFEGESTVEIMNLLGYRAAAIGNHEFDFDQSGLSARVAQAAYPYLSANIVEDATGSAPSWAKPYTIVTMEPGRRRLRRPHDRRGRGLPSAHPKSRCKG